MLTRTMKDHPKAFGVSCDYIKVDRHDQYIERDLVLKKIPFLAVLSTLKID